MRRSRTTNPSRALTQKQDRFVRLIAQGVPNAEACRVVGVDRRTGTRWRLGRMTRTTADEPVHYPPVQTRPAMRSRHPKYLSLAERTAIADLHRERRPLREIAAVIGRSPSTVSLELRRNAEPVGRYLPKRLTGWRMSEFGGRAVGGCWLTKNSRRGVRAAG